MELFYVLNLVSLISVFGFAGWLVVIVLKTSSPSPARRNSRSRKRSSVDSLATDQLYLDTNLEIISSNYYDESDADGDSMDDYQSLCGSRRASFADRLYELSCNGSPLTNRRRSSCIDLKRSSDFSIRRSSSTLMHEGLRKRSAKFDRNESDPGGHDTPWNAIPEELQYRGPPRIALTTVDGIDAPLSLSSDDNEHAKCDGDVNPQIVEEYLSQHSTGMPRKLSDQRRGSFLYRSEADSSSRGLSRTSSISSMNDKNGLEDIIVTPFAQILARLRDVRHAMSKLTSLPAADDEPAEETRLSGHDQQQMLLDGLIDIDWVLDHLNKIKARNSVGEMAHHKFRRMLTRELSQFSETSKSGNQVAEWVSSTYFDRDEDEIDLLEKTKSLIPTYAKRILTQTQQALKGNIPKYGVEVDDEEAMDRLVGQLNIWNFDIWKFSVVTKDHPLVAISYVLLQERGFLRNFNIDVPTFLKYMFVIEAKYHTQNPYHNATHGADVMQSCHVLLGYPVVEQVFTDLEVFAALFAAAVHDVDHPGLTNHFLSTTSSDLAILYNDHAVLENHHLAITFKFMQDDELNWMSGIAEKQRALMRKMVIDLVLATDMSKHLSLMADIKTTVESSKVAHNGKLILESYNERMLVLQGIVHSCDIGSATKIMPIYKTWTERIIEEFCLQGDKERDLNIPISPMCDRFTLSLEKSQVGFIDFIVQPQWETLSELMYPFCQEMLTQISENRQYYFMRIPESPRGSVTDSPNLEERNSLIALAEKRKIRAKGHAEDDKLSDLSSIDEADEPEGRHSTSDS